MPNEIVEGTLCAMTPWITIAFSALVGAKSPSETVVPLLDAIDSVVVAEPEWNGLDRPTFAILLLQIAYEESKLDMMATGDSGKAHCAFQVHEKPDLVATPEGCVHAAVDHLRESLRMAPDAPLAQYMGSKDNPKVRAMAEARYKRGIKLAKKVLTQINAEDTEAEEPLEEPAIFIQ